MHAKLDGIVVALKTYHRHPIVRVSVCVAVLLLLHLMGWLFPLIRFSLLASVTAATAGAIYSCARIVIQSHTTTDPQHPSHYLAHKTTGFACGLLAVVCGLLLFLLPSPRQVPPVKESSPSAPASPAAKVSQAETGAKVHTSPVTDESPNGNSSPVPRDASIDQGIPQTFPSSTASNRESRQPDVSEQGVADFFGALLQAGAQQEQAGRTREYQEFQQGAENARRCPRCGGAGVYRYVDGAGVLQARTCPSCMGSGRAF